jgi:protein arginine kinase activator
MADRPVECSQCKKAIKTIYKEIVDGTPLCFEMCSACPVLEQKLHGSASQAKHPQIGLCCENCRTPIESIKMGNTLGCKECYAIFSDVLVEELISRKKLPKRTKKTKPLHSGRSPQQSLHILPINQLSTLHDALNDALKKENYEQAAWLRDQIKALNEKAGHGKN